MFLEERTELQTKDSDIPNRGVHRIGLDVYNPTIGQYV
jgi:hypothetical protein